MVDAPVSGGFEGARNATLTIFVGGDVADVEHARPVLNGWAHHHACRPHRRRAGDEGGQPGHPLRHVPGGRRGIVLAIKAGLDAEQVVAALCGGAARSWVLENRSRAA